MSSTKAITSFQHDQFDMFSASRENTYNYFDGVYPSELSPSRGSFARNCLITVVSKMGIEIEVEYFEKESGIVAKVDSVIISARDAPLKDIFMETASLSKKFKEASVKEPGHVIHCYAGDITGEEISLTQCPKDIDYVIDAMRNNTRPVLILCKEPKAKAKPEKDLKKKMDKDDDEDDEMVGFTGRTASGMVQEMLKPLSSPKRSVPSSPSDDSIFTSSIERTFLPGNVGSRSHSIWSMPKAVLHKFEEEHTATSGEEEEEEEEESDGDSSTSSRQSYSKESTTSNSSASSISEEGSPDNRGFSRSQPLGNRNGMFRSVMNIHPPIKEKRGLFNRGSKEKEERSLPDLYNKSCKTRRQKISDPGYHTFHSSKSKKTQHRFSMKPKHQSTEYEITSPSLSSTIDDSAAKKLIRQSAIRRGKQDLSQPSLTIPESSYSLEINNVNVIFKTTKIEVPCREHNTVQELKEAIAGKLNKMDPDCCVPWRSKDFIVTYEMDGCTYELFDKWQFIYKTALYLLWVKEGSPITPIRLQMPAREMSGDIKVVYRISQLIGLIMDENISSLPGADTSRLRKVAGPDQKEAVWTRRVLHNFVKEVVRKRDKEDYSLSMELVSSSASTILALKIPIDSKIKVKFHYKCCFSLVKQVKVQRTAESVLKEIFPCLVACGLVDNRIGEYTMQISGERSYIAGNHALIDFKDIRRCIIKGEPVNLSIKEKPNSADDTPCKLNWLPIDPFSGFPPLHTDISRSVHHDCEVQALSSWDREDDFTLRVEQVENLPIFSNRTSYSTIIKATLYHGDKPLCPPVTTTTKGLDSTIILKETMNFRFPKKNIPRAAKILFLVSEPLQRKESVGVKKTPKYLFWGLTMVFDHQGMMYNGEHTMTLWRGKRDKEEKDGSKDNTYIPNPSGPASNNNDPKAVILTIKFDSYSFPIHFPSCSPQSWSVLLTQPNVANVAVRRQFQRLLEFIREGKLHSAVPAYIEKVNWGNLAESLEVYSLLDQISDSKQEFPVKIALKLLDCDFPDESVRNFATKVLEEVSDERLEDYLLQLTQALKFEPHHDSLLARFLLKRALCNKIIGHFFFWYLKCEMVNPQYTTRFGVILEAYLMSCGESMLKQFEHQVEMQTTLEEIGLELKQRCNDDQSKMQALLPEMLEAHRVPEFEITPVYNPRIRLGNLRPNKCKIMSSKKKPQWLEMSNVDETALEQTPTRLILKMGDDLRQDMITLRMFSLFEKLWEVDGLNLSLIPYGCIATGPDTGFIEVVKNAKTIAEVSGLNNQTKLLDWIKSHHKNEFGEEDGDKVKDAVNTFVHSCAGYSVATYVLGIGDRHNDNIMVTTSGNLFHIDFGHFLGNIKYCMGFKREWAPFVLTPDFVYVMGGEDSSSFDMYKNLCCRAFLTLRRNAELIINLFSLMRSTGIPELTCVEDTDYIKNALVLEKSEHDAEQMFRKVIKKCLDLKWTVQVMWKFHLIRKRGSS